MSEPIWKTEMRYNDDGDKLFYENDQLHRLDGPAVTTVDGNKYWYRWGKRHREDGPACESTDGSRCWYFAGMLHRLDGPAIVWADGTELYYIHGKEFSEQEFRLHPETYMEDDMSADTPVSFPAKLRAAYKLSKLASNEEKKLVLETARQVMEDKASEGWESISFEKLNSITYLEVKDSVRTSSFTDAFNFATAMLTSEGVPKDNHVSRGDYFYWSDSE